MFWCIQLIGQIDTKGTEFWLGFMENLSLDLNSNPEFFIQVSGHNSGTGVISAPGIANFNIQFEYEAGQVKKVAFPLGILYAEGSEVVSDLGFKITTSTPVEVSAIHYRRFFSEASNLLPIPMLGSNYRVISVHDLDQKPASSYSSFNIVATQDGTKVEITPTAYTIGNKVADHKYIMQLEEGQSFQVQAIGDLSGSTIRELNGKGIAVFGGAKQADVHCTFADNHIWDQLLPNKLLSTEYTVEPFKSQDFSILKIIAYENNTEISIGDENQPILNEGKSSEFVLREEKLVTSNQPIQVALINPSSNCTFDGFEDNAIGDPNMLVIPSIDCLTYNSSFWLEDFFDEDSNDKHYLTLIASDLQSNSVIVDGEEINSLFAPLENNSDYFYCNYKLDPGTHNVISELGVQAYAYGFGRFDAYTYHLNYESKREIPTNEPFINSIQIFPNPVYSQFTIVNSTRNQINSILILDVQGRLIQKLDSINPRETREVNISHLPSSIYLITYESDGKWTTEKLVKIE